MDTTTSSSNLDWHTQEHPIDPQIRAEIDKTLARIESEHQVRVLFACESGSRGWGFASPDSDYDVRFIYVNRPDWYLTVLPGRDVIELPVNDTYDVSGWDLRKTLGLLRNGNATVVEWLSSPVVYRADVNFVDQIRAAADLVHRPDRVFHHYLQMARKNYREYLQGERVRLKKYLYVLRPLLAALWIEQQRGPVPMRFLDLVDALVTETALRTAIDELLVIKRRSGEAEEGLPLPEINRFLDAQLRRLEQIPTPQKDERGDYSVLDRLLRDMVLRN
ncbi:nucleotidyltransferase [Herbaspirillum rubrisubalbicans]|uniref:Nucleotidyltransferase n=1 Tax=Herbaspirillum rubrisubalbicans TaxID=80842 RepID=A0ABX9BY75_9BURK|nr:nucleotidyltransferase domain-containing protein [Herbaspirillum rubrisubalbicans]NQE50827.1 nucleotidyltransferase [Herbaspirillum rubrisubalbicans]RAM62939.1 nucleotidyltransferase [Herbaspirillum rubrisubalbicans]RAN46707.1 nucleotidyltransferase [Herbaspirillum rubrisubalbicans]